MGTQPQEEGQVGFWVGALRGQVQQRTRELRTETEEPKRAVTELKEAQSELLRHRARRGGPARQPGNARHAREDAATPDKKFPTRAASEEGKTGIFVIGNGVGISAGNLTRIFSHGFTRGRTGTGSVCILSLGGEGAGGLPSGAE